MSARYDIEACHGDHYVYDRRTEERVAGPVPYPVAIFIARTLSEPARGLLFPRYDGVMVDLETMGTSSNAPVMAVGAVIFSPNDMDYCENDALRFYMRVPLASAMAAGAVPDASTIEWWLGQSDEARKELLAGERKELKDVLHSFRCFYRTASLHLNQHKPAPDGSERNGACVWGNGATFDPVILENAYKSIGETAPWPYYRARCFRTVKDEYPKQDLDRVGTHHAALDDAVWQAQYLQLLEFKYGRELK